MTENPDPQKLELLDRYLAQLQAGQQPDRSAIIRQHPELASALNCLEMLEQMASLPAEEAAG